MSDAAPNIDFAALTTTELPPLLVRQAQVVWAERVRTEYQSIQIAARFLTETLAAGEPLEVTRRVMETIDEEARHTELCTAMCRALGGTVPALKSVAAPIADLSEVPIDERVLASSISLFLVAEAFSVGYLRDLAERATHPVTRAVLGEIVGDEAGHESFGVELVAGKLKGLPEAKRSAWRGFTVRLVNAHLDRAARVLEKVPESERHLDKHPETERATLGLLGEVRLALLCQRTYRDKLLPVLQELGLAPG